MEIYQKKPPNKDYKAVKVVIRWYRIDVQVVYPD